MSQSPQIGSLAASRCGGDLVAMGMRQSVLSALRLSGATDGRRERRTDTVSRTWHVLALSTPPGAARHPGHLLITRPLQLVRITLFVFGSIRAEETTNDDESRSVFKGDATFQTLSEKKKEKNNAALSGPEGLIFLRSI